MALKLSNSKPDHFIMLIPVRHLIRLRLCLLVLFFTGVTRLSFSQQDNTSAANYKADSSYNNFNTLRYPVARAQINLLKKDGALLVRLKTNANTINRLKVAGNMDLATQVERETFLNNKAIVRAYTKEFTFCPVYFFNSDCSDSVKHKNLDGIFLDTNLTTDPSIICKASFYLVAEQGNIYESSLGLVPESAAAGSVERGAPSKEVFIVVKNRYFIQLHKPFPYYQAGYSPKKYAAYVKRFNALLVDFYEHNKNFMVPPELKEYVY